MEGLLKNNKDQDEFIEKLLKEYKESIEKMVKEFGIIQIERKVKNEDVIDESLLRKKKQRR